MTIESNTQQKSNSSLHLILQNLEQLQQKQLFFLGGFIKSGTTWIERLLDSHPEIACKGEAHFPRLLQPVLRSAIANYNNVIPDKGNWERLKNEGVHDIETAEYCYTEQDLNDIYALSIQLLMSKWCGDGIKAVGEKTPNNANFFSSLLQLFPQAKFIYIVRDIRDVIVSGWFFNLAIDSDRTLENFSSLHHYAVHIAQHWVQEVAEARKFIDLHQSQATLIKYEDLWNSPETNARRLLQFIGVQDTNELVEFCLKSTDFSNLSGGRNRGTENRGSFYRKGIIGDWKNHLEQETLLEIEMYCGAMLDHLGYEQYQP